MNATLSSLAIGSRTLSPTFDPDVHSYVCTTHNSVDVVTATALEGIDLTLVVNGVRSEFGAIGWNMGINTVQVITNYDGVARESYVVSVDRRSGEPDPPTPTPK